MVTTPTAATKSRQLGASVNHNITLDGHGFHLSWPNDPQPFSVLARPVFTSCHVLGIAPTDPRCSIALEVQHELGRVAFGALLPTKDSRTPATPKASLSSVPGGDRASSLPLRIPSAADKDRDLDVLPIPKSLQEIYAVSNKNRKKAAKVRPRLRVEAV